MSQALPGTLEVTFAGAEANAAASLGMLGVDVQFVTALPCDSPLTGPCLSSLRSAGVGTEHVRLTGDGRFGLFFVESGANQRPTRVDYDRDRSAISLAQPDDFEWSQIFAGADWFLVTGITPALSESAARLTLAALHAARQAGCRVAFDFNYRSKLWRWDSTVSPRELAVRTIRDLLPFVDLLFGGADDAEFLGLAVASGITGDPLPQLDRQLAACHALAGAFPNVQLIAGSVRIQHSASHNDWGGVLFDVGTGHHWAAPCEDGCWKPYEIRTIVDRVGSGDAFDAGVLFGLCQKEYSPQDAINFATAAGCLAHSVTGDWNYATRADVEALMRGDGRGRILR
jgi:2-dehydro-3-deoxygluconokinase